MLLFIAVCAIICGYDSFIGIAAFAQEQRDWLAQYVQFPSYPSHDTFRRMFLYVDHMDLQKHLIQWLESLPTVQKDPIFLRQISIDGKIVCASKDENTRATYLLNCWATQTKCVLAQLKLPEGSNEITGIPIILQRITFDNAVITIDAIGCQKENANLIVENKGHYLFALKGNQQQFYKDVRDYLMSVYEKEFVDLSLKAHETHEHQRGQFVDRYCYTVKAGEWLTQLSEWRGLKTLVMLRTVIKKQRKKTQNLRFFITSLPNDPALILHYIRSHWSIENHLHRMLDMYFLEDKSRARRGFSQANLSMMRSFAISLIYNCKSKYSQKLRLKTISGDIRKLEKALCFQQI